MSLYTNLNTFWSSVILIAISFTLLPTLAAQAPAYSRVTVFFDSTHTPIKLAKTGIDLTHGKMKQNQSFTTDLSVAELNRIKQKGFRVEVIISDIQSFYKQQLTLPDQKSDLRSGCDQPTDDTLNYATPDHFELGDMGGYYTYEEMLEQFERMAQEYPDLVSPIQPIEGFTTHEGRPIYWLRISDNPNMDESGEPEVLYTALHHAREPMSLTQMIFYAWYLLEHYESSEEIRFLVDETEMYFIPCINPDGYIYNQTNHPDGGGMWRKNRRDNQDGTWGVDLNRNYGFKWGHDDVGSSPEGWSQVYRGPFPFSEPEIQAVKAFCEDHQFRLALNYHTFGNLLIYPWGYSDTPSPDSLAFFTLSGLLTEENDYLFGTGTETVGYTVNGTSDDWMYGEESSKNAIFSLTPEVGSSNHGFWPPVSKIEAHCKSVLRKNLNAVFAVHNFGVATLKSDPNVAELSGNLEVDIQQFGLTGGELLVTVSSTSPAFLYLEEPKQTNLSFGNNINLTFEYELNAGVQVGEEMTLLIQVDNGKFANKFPVSLTYKPQQTVLSDAGDNLDDWKETGLWGLTSKKFKSPPTAFTDSPNRDYPYSYLSTMQYEDWVDLTDATEAYIRYWASWDIRDNGDFAQIEMSLDGNNWTGLCGHFTTDADVGDGIEPVYTGQQETWVLEQVDLAPCLGKHCLIRFSMKSGSIFQEGDGIFIDDVELKVVSDNTTSSGNPHSSDLIDLYPNPASDYINIIGIQHIAPNEHTISYQILDLLGRVVKQGKISSEQLPVISVQSIHPGTYLIEIEEQIMKKLVILD